MFVKGMGAWMNEIQHLAALPTCERNVKPPGKWTKRGKKEWGGAHCFFLCSVRCLPGFSRPVTPVHTGTQALWRAEFRGAVFVSVPQRKGSVNAGTGEVGTSWATGEAVSVWKILWAPWKKCSVAILGFCLGSTFILVQSWKMILHQQKRWEWN